MKKCSKCDEEKELTEFFKIGKWFRSKCKKCHRIPKKEKKENTGRFKKGCKTFASFPKGHIPWNKDRIDKNAKGRKSGNDKIFRTAVLERDGHKCIKCGATEKLHVHHIIPWNQDESKRFVVENGLTLCSKHHYLEEDVLNKLGVKGHFKKHTEEAKKKISESKKGKKLSKRVYKNGYTPWNKGKKLSEDHVKKLREAKIGYVPWNKKTKKE